MKKKYNPFKMFGSWIGYSLFSIIYFYKTGNIDIFKFNIGYIDGELSFSIGWTILGFLIGWGINSLIIKNRRR